MTDITYRSKSQLARITTEAWLENNGYCVACAMSKVTRTMANTKAKDFQCNACGHGYELKASQKPFGRYVIAGSYAAMTEQIEHGQVSNLLLMQYTMPVAVQSLVLVHRAFITREIIVPRKALSPTARRAGWVGCKIALFKIPPEGRIVIIQAGSPQPTESVRQEFQKAERLATFSGSARSWTLAILNCIHALQQQDFTLPMIYKHESQLAAQYPNNHNVRAKIRQQLQVLRDAGYIQFLGSGSYRLSGAPKLA